MVSLDTALTGLQTFLGAFQESSRVASSDDRRYAEAYADVPDEPPRHIA